MVLALCLLHGYRGARPRRRRPSRSDTPHGLRRHPSTAFEERLGRCPSEPCLCALRPAALWAFRSLDDAQRTSAQHGSARHQARHRTTTGTRSSEPRCWQPSPSATSATAHPARRLTTWSRWPKAGPPTDRTQEPRARAVSSRRRVERAHERAHVYERGGTRDPGGGLSIPGASALQDR